MVDAIEWACVLCDCSIQNDWASGAMNLHQICIKLEYFSAETVWMTWKAAAISNWWLTVSSPQHTCSCIASGAEFFDLKHKITQVTQPHYSSDLVPCDFWLFSKLKSLLKGKRFQTVSVIQENMMGQLIAIGRTVWGPKVPCLKGTEASSSCTVLLVSSSINVCFLYCMFGYFLDRPRI